MSRPLAAGLCALACHCPAAEAVVRDLSLLGEQVPVGFDYTLGRFPVQRSGHDALSDHLAWRLAGRWAWSRPGAATAPLLGLDLAWHPSDLANGGSAELLSATPVAGWCWAPLDRLTLAIEGFAGLGLNRLAFPSTASSYGWSASGTCLGAGGRAGARWRFGEGLLLAAEAGWSWWDHRLSSGTMGDLTFTRQGLVLSLGLGWRFGSAPATLE